MQTNIYFPNQNAINSDLYYFITKFVLFLLSELWAEDIKLNTSEKNILIRGSLDNNILVILEIILLISSLTILLIQIRAWRKIWIVARLY